MTMINSLPTPVVQSPAFEGKNEKVTTLIVDRIAMRVPKDMENKLRLKVPSNESIVIKPVSRNWNFIKAIRDFWAKKLK